MITFYVMVNDLQAYLDKSVNLCAAQVLSPMEMEVKDSKFAIAGFIDPEGKYIGLFKPIKTRQKGGGWQSCYPPLLILNPLAA